MSSGLFQVDEEGLLFISPAIHDWGPILARGIDAVIDLEGGLDHGVPTVPDGLVYLYYPIYDEDLPDPDKLDAVVALGVALVRARKRVLSHCGMGFNRSALVAGLILCRLGHAGPDVVKRLRLARPGALFNERFCAHLQSLR